MTRSSRDAEHRSLATILAEIIWLKSLLLELQLPVTQIPSIYYDNLSAVMMIANPILHQCSKDFELDLHFVCKIVARKLISVSHILPMSKLLMSSQNQSLLPSFLILGANSKSVLHPL